MHAPWALAAAMLVTACAQSANLAPDSGQVASDALPCESTLDAIGLACTDGLEFSVRYDPESQCAVLFLYDNTLVLPYDPTTGANTNGAITLEHNGSSATLSRITSGAASQCEMVE